MVYGKVQKSIWNDRKFRKLSSSGKLIFLCMLTYPAMTQLGAMRATGTGLRAELGLSSTDFDAAMAELRALGLVRDDPPAAYIEIVNFLRYNPPSNPNQVKSWTHVIQLLPECELKTERLRGAISQVKRRGWSVPREVLSAAGLGQRAETNQMHCPGETESADLGAKSTLI